jgi:anti-anti-sigma factor
MLTSPRRSWPGRVTVASVADSDDVVIAMIFRHTEPSHVQPSHTQPSHMQPSHTQPTRHTQPTGASDAAPTTIISVQGDVDHDTAPYLERVLQLAVDTAAGPVCCDLSGADFVSATGVGVFFVAAQRAHDAGAAFTLRGLHGIAERVFDALGFDRSMIVN